MSKLLRVFVVVMGREDCKIEYNYLVEFPEKEPEAVKRFLQTPLKDGVFHSLGFDPRFFWRLLQVPHRKLVPAFEGDVDIIAGRFDLAASGGVRWQPSTNYLVGIEAKCAFLPPNAPEVSESTLKSKKSGRIAHIQNQVDRLLQMGFDRVILLDLIANPPAQGKDSQAWLAASELSHRTELAMSRVLQKRLPPSSPAGHWVVSLGAVVGGDETLRGAGFPTEIRKSTNNPFLSDPTVCSYRSEMNKNLECILRKMSLSDVFPVIEI